MEEVLTSQQGELEGKPVVLVIKGTFNWTVLGRILGSAVYPKKYQNYQGDICGLAKGKISYKIYNDHKDFSLGVEYGGTRSAHVCLHSDGICFTPSLRVQCDLDFARELYNKVLAKIAKERSCG